MPPKPKRTSQTRTRSSIKRPRVTELIETRPGLSDQQQPATSTEQPLVTVNMQALSASISSAVQPAVAEVMKAQWPAAPSQETQSSTDQSVANIVNTSLAEITQDSIVQGTFTPSRRIASNSARDSFAEELVANLESFLSSVLASGSGKGSACVLVGVPHSVALWRFFPPPLLKRYLVYYILADLENKVRHLWWPNFLQPNPTLCLSPQQTSAPPRRALGHAMQGFQRSSYRKNGLI